MRRLLGVAMICLASGTASAASLLGLDEPMPYRRLSLDVGAGTIAFFSGGAAGTSGVWDVRAGYSIVPRVTIEGGYTGSAGDAPGSGALISTIVEGDARVNFLPARRLSPYLLGGVGWGAFSGTSGYKSDNATVVMPLGAGADYRISDRFVAGGRFTYRAVFADHLGPFNAGADHWEAIARVGTKF